MAPRKKRALRVFSARTRSGMKYQGPEKDSKKNIMKKAVDGKKTKETITTPQITQPMLTRSHKKFGKYRFFTEYGDECYSNISTDDTVLNINTENNESEGRSTEEILLPEHTVTMEKENDIDIGIQNKDDSTDQFSNIGIKAPNDNVLYEENISLESEKNVDKLEHEKMESLITENSESIIAHQLSNLNVNSNVSSETDQTNIEIHEDYFVENIQYISESVKADDIYHLDNFESEVIIDCISEDVIPICGEQEVANDNDNYSDTQELDKEVSEEMKINEKKQLSTENVIEILMSHDVSLDNLESTDLSQNTDADTSKLKTVVEKNTFNTEDLGTVKKQEDNNVRKVEDEIGKEENSDKVENPTFTEDISISSEAGIDAIDLKSGASKCKTKGKLTKKKSEKLEKDAEKLNQVSESSVRRSNRIKSISVLKQKSSKGHGLVKQKNEVLLKNNADCTETTNLPTMDVQNNKSGQKISNSAGTSSTIQGELKPVKVKSRWRRSSELELNNTLPHNSNKVILQTLDTLQSNSDVHVAVDEAIVKKDIEEVAKRLKQFIYVKENLYLTERLSCKEAKKMVCDCFLTEEDIQQGEYGCGEDCLNRLLMIECGSLCTVGDRCTNKRFQKGLFAPCEVFQTEKKGLGIRAAANIPYGDFILEYVGEVLDPEEFEKRAAEYSKDKNQHYYFMSLRADAVIDATRKGNISRFINHSCDPNAETQKWTVNGELRIGFFSKRTILAGEEITFDYQFQRYGKEAQKCYCEASSCRGWLGEEPEDEDDEDDDDDEEEEDEEDEGDETEIEKIGAELGKKDSVEETVSSDTSDNREKIGEIGKPIVEKSEKVVKREKKKILRQRLPRKDIFEDLDLDDEIETLQTTGLKNQAHTLKLSRLMVRAKEPAQRTKLLRVLRRGELPCRRLFLDYHGLRLIHGWMTDAQHMARINKKMESLRLEILQTLATLPIPNKTMLQDSKVLPTVEKWSIKLEEEVSPIDSDSNSPKIEMDNLSHSINEGRIKNVELCKIEQGLSTNTIVQCAKSDVIGKSFDNSDISIGDALQEDMDISSEPFNEKEQIAKVKSLQMDTPSLSSSTTPCVDDYETEIIALALKLLEEWSVLKEVFRIPKKERIEQMKEHEREADRKYKAGLGLDGQDVFIEKKDLNRYRLSRRQKRKKRKSSRLENDSAFIDKYERRKMFALQVEQREMERRRNQREFWRQHEQRCVVMGADPRFTAPFEPNQGYQCVWNPQTGQWHNYPFPGTQNFNPNLPPPHQHHSHQQQQQQQQSQSQQQQQHMLPGQSNQQQLLMSQHGHIVPNQQSTLSVNRPPPSMLPTMQHNQQMMKHLQNVNLPLSHGLHPKPLPNFNSQHSASPHTSNSSQHQFNVRAPPPSAINVPLSINHIANVNVPNVHIPQQQRTNNQCIPYHSSVSDHIQQQQQIPQQQQTPPSNFHLPHDNQNLMHANLNVHNKLPPPLPALPYQETIKEQEDTLQVKFMGPIPPPVKLPPKWKCAKDKYGRPYYYHIRIRKSQWEPPEFPADENEELSESTSSSDTSSLSSDTSSEETDSDDDIDDAKLLLQLKNKFKQMDALKANKASTETKEIGATCDDDGDGGEDINEKSLDDRLIEEFCFMKGDTATQVKRKRVGLVQEILISPRTEEDRLQFKEDMKRYKQNKEKLKRQKELLLEQSKKHTNFKTSKSPIPAKPIKGSKKHKISVKTKLKEMTDSEVAKKIKETFRSSMAVVMVSILNTYRKPECKEGRITNTEDFKHLARKLTHFVMLKELKHCQNIEDLTCTESVKSKAKEFVRKYMSKFGEVYQKPKDEAEFY